MTIHGQSWFNVRLRDVSHVSHVSKMRTTDDRMTWWRWWAWNVSNWTWPWNVKNSGTKAPTRTPTLLRPATLKTTRSPQPTQGPWPHLKISTWILYHNTWKSISSRRFKIYNPTLCFLVLNGSYCLPTAYLEKVSELSLSYVFGKYNYVQWSTDLVVENFAVTNHLFKTSIY